MSGNSYEVPIGAVLDWWRDPNALDPIPVPSGYAICDGSEVTDTSSPFHGSKLPDLSQRFVRGVVTTADIGQTGGFTTAPLPALTGSCADSGGDPGAESYKVRDDNQGWGTDVHLRVDDGNSSEEGQHRHDLGGTVPILPPYYGLLKIMRIV